MNEYYAVEKLDPSKLPYLQQQIWDLVQKTNLQADLDLKNMLSRDHGDHKHEWDDELTPEGVPATLAEMSGNEVAHLIEDLDGYLCELGMAQIRDGLHILGQMPPLPEMLRSLTRLSNDGVPSLQASLAAAFGFDLALLLAEAGRAICARPDAVRAAVPYRMRMCSKYSTAQRSIFTPCWRRLAFAAEEIAGVQHAVLGLGVGRDGEGAGVRLHRTWCRSLSRQAMRSSTCSTRWKESMCLPGRRAHRRAAWRTFCPPAEISMPSIRRALPSQAAWRVGQQLAREAIERFRKEEGEYPGDDGPERLGNLADAHPWG